MCIYIYIYIHTCECVCVHIYIYIYKHRCAWAAPVVDALGHHLHDAANLSVSIIAIYIYIYVGRIFRIIAIMITILKVVLLPFPLL